MLYSNLKVELSLVNQVLMLKLFKLTLSFKKHDKKVEIRDSLSSKFKMKRDFKVILRF